MLAPEYSNEKAKLDIPFFGLAVLFCLWGLSEYLYPPSADFFERTVPKLVHALLLLWSFLCIVYDIRVHKPIIIFKRSMRWGIILAGILFFFPFLAYTIEKDGFRFFKSNIYAGFYITQWCAIMLFCVVHMQANPKAYRTFIYFVPAMTVFFFIATMEHTQQNIASKGDESYQAGIYAGYYLICLYPFIWDIRNKILKYALLLLIIYGVIYSMKRGAMVCLLASLFISFLFHYLFFATGLKRIPYFYAMIILFVALNMAIMYSINQKQDTFERRMENLQDGSGRVEIYQEAFRRFSVATPTEKIFGSQQQRFSAHNDFLFLLVNFGVIGFLTMVIFNIQWLRLAMEVIRVRLPIMPSFLVALVNGFLIEMVSYGVEGHAYMICCVYIGMVQGYVLSDEMNSEEIDVIEQYDDEWMDDSEEMPFQDVPAEILPDPQRDPSWNESIQIRSDDPFFPETMGEGR